MVLGVFPLGVVDFNGGCCLGLLLFVFLLGLMSGGLGVG